MALILEAKTRHTLPGSHLTITSGGDSPQGSERGNGHEDAGLRQQRRGPGVASLSEPQTDSQLRPQGLAVAQGRLE